MICDGIWYDRQGSGIKTHNSLDKNIPSQIMSDPIFITLRKISSLGHCSRKLSFFSWNTSSYIRKIHTSTNYFIIPNNIQWFLIVFNSQKSKTLIFNFCILCSIFIILIKFIFGWTCFHYKGIKTFHFSEDLIIPVVL